MRIQKDDSIVTFGMLSVGDVFEYCSGIYVKTIQRDNINCLCFNEDKLICLSDETPVTPKKESILIVK